MNETAFDRLRDALARHGSRIDDKSQNNFMAQCRAHEDHNPSLNVTGIEGQALAHCFAGCTNDAVLGAIGWESRDLFDNPKGVDYRYDDGRIVHRSPNKKFRQSGNRGAPQLYRSRKVARAVGAGERVFLVEGEKDVHALESVGAVATTAPQGAASFGRADVSPLQGAVVVAVVDNDSDGGQKWAPAVRDKLDGIVKSLRFVQAAAGKDAADHIAAGHGVDDFVPLDHAAPIVSATNPDNEPQWETPERIANNAKTPLPGAGTANIGNIGDAEARSPRALWAMVDAVAEAYQVPRDLPFLLILAILAASIGGRRRVRVTADWVEVASIYSVVGLPSGERKSPVLRVVSEPLKRVEDDLAEQKAPEIAMQRAKRDLYQSAVDKLKRKGDTSEDGIANLEGAVMDLEKTAVPALPRILADDSTPEAMARIMSEQGGRLGVLSAEAGLFATLAGRYSSGVPNLDLVLKAWSGDECRVDRISRDPIILREPVLSIGLAVQPAIMASLAEGRNFRGTGLLARFLFALPDSLVGRRSIDPPPVPEVIAKDYCGAVEALAREVLDSEDRELVLTDDARALLMDYRAQLEPKLHPEFGELSHIDDWANKLPGQLVRIAALFALFNNPKAAVVDGVVMDEAIGLADYFTNHALAAFDLMSGRRSPMEPPRAMLRWIAKKQLSEFSVRQAWRELSGQEWVTDTDAIREAVADLEDMGWVWKVPPEQKRGRPSERYLVNPLGDLGGRRGNEVANNAKAQSTTPPVSRPAGRCRACGDPMDAYMDGQTTHPNCEPS